MTRLIPKRLAIVLYCSLAVNVLLAGIIAAVYFKDHQRRGVRGMLYSVPWAARVIGKEVRPKARELYRSRLEQIQASRDKLNQNYEQVNAALAADPFEKAKFDTALNDLRVNALARQEMIHRGMTELATGLTAAQRRKLADEVKKWAERRERRRQRRLEHLQKESR
ncbi:MAG: periplasmic heavy metal sensor [Rhodospirillaceae bacterium]